MGFKMVVLLVLFGHSMAAGSTDYRSIYTQDESDPRIKHYQLKSSETGVVYPVHVFLPRDYEQSDKSYPIIYATDGQWLADLFGFLREKELILVAIEQGPDNRRMIDYGPGSEAYFSFLTQELLPFVEEKHRVDSANRSLLGVSIGGLFVGYALLSDKIENPYFSVYGAFDGAFSLAEESLQKMNGSRRSRSQDLDATLFLTGAMWGNAMNVQKFKKSLENSRYKGLRIFHSTHWVKHENITTPSFEEMVKLLY